MAETPTALHWPDPNALDPCQADPDYNAKIDTFELRFTRETIPRVEIPLEAIGHVGPWASVRLDSEDEITGEVVGLMIENLSLGFDAYSGWRNLAEGLVTSETLRTIIETLSRLSPEPD